MEVERVETAERVGKSHTVLLRHRLGRLLTSLTAPVQVSEFLGRERYARGDRARGRGRATATIR